MNGIGLSDAKLQFSTAPTPFGVVDANAPKTETLTVTNTGGVPSGNLAVETKGAAFGVVPGGTCMNGAPLASGASCTVIVQFAPAAIGPVTGSISVSATPGGSASADLGGTGQKTVTLTVIAGGTGTGTLSVDGVACAAFPCSIAYKISDPNRSANVVQTPGPLSDFVGWKLDCAGTGSCSPKLNQDRTVEADYILKQYAIQVTLKNLRGTPGGSVTATSIPEGPELSCLGNVCSAQYSAGAVVTLTATGTGQTLFQSWGAECSSRFDSTCTTGALTGSFATTVSFRPAINYMFVSSGTIGPLTLGGDLDTADALCDSGARAAWLVNTPTSKPRYFKALVSTTTADARTRIDGSRGWIRPDGREFADLPQNLFDEAGASSPFQVFYPPNVTEQGVKLSDSSHLVVTASGSDGRALRDNSGLAYTCHDWGSGAISGSGFSQGLPSGGAGDWLDGIFSGDSCNFLVHVYCFETAQPKTALVANAPAQKRLAFVSTGKVLGSNGRDAADALCEAEAQQNALPGSYLALMSGANQTPASRFDLSGPPWVRPDGVLIANTATAFSTMPYNWLAPLNQRADGSYVVSGAPLLKTWIGSKALDAVSDTNDPNCDNWGSAAASGATSLAATRLSDNVDSGGSQSCSTAQAVFCLQK